ncbi:MAG: hypothetical protein LC797_21755 [Chloroflexi bacterium]|nr:hypothetical protein [Chloroflexota bacterium]
MIARAGEFHNELTMAGCVGQGESLPGREIRSSAIANTHQAAQIARRTRVAAVLRVQDVSAFVRHLAR